MSNCSQTCEMDMGEEMQARQGWKSHPHDVVEGDEGEKKEMLLKIRLMLRKGNDILPEKRQANPGFPTSHTHTHVRDVHGRRIARPSGLAKSPSQCRACEKKEMLLKIRLMLWKENEIFRKRGRPVLDFPTDVKVQTDTCI